MENTGDAASEAAGPGTTEPDAAAVDATPVLAPAPPAEATVYPARFTGLASEYFRIWIVSLCLSILTFGIYSAWGKVRKKRYLYAHTFIDGSSFQFTGRPIAVLRGRVIAVILFGGLAIAGHFFGPAQIAFVLLLLLLTPWIVVAGNRFNSHNSTFRNIRFGFDGHVGRAAKIFLGIGLLLLPTIGLIYPYYRMRRLAFVMGHQRYGATPFTTSYLGEDFYAAYILGGLIMFAGALVGGVAAAMGFALRSKAHAGASTQPTMLLLTLLIYATYLLGFCYVRARVGNLTFNQMQLAAMRFSSKLRVRDLGWLYLSNIVAIFVTVGLATPWAIIRIARYRAERLTLSTTVPLSEFAAAATPDATATAAEVSDLFDVDISL